MGGGEWMGKRRCLGGGGWMQDFTCVHYNLCLPLPACILPLCLIIVFCLFVFT